jgi:hypothetical protein
MKKTLFFLIFVSTINSLYSSATTDGLTKLPRRRRSKRAPTPISHLIECAKNVIKTIDSSDLPSQNHLDSLDTLIDKIPATERPFDILDEALKLRVLLSKPHNRKNFVSLSSSEELSQKNERPKSTDSGIAPSPTDLLEKK